MFPYLKEHGTETYVVEILGRFPRRKRIGKISLISLTLGFHLRIRVVVPCHLRHSQEMKRVPQTSEKKIKQSPLVCRLLIACSTKAPAGNSAVGHRLLFAWKVNKEMSAGVQQWLTSGSAFSWHFWVALPCSAPQKHFKWCGRYFVWKSKACCMGLKRILLFHPLFKLLFRSRLY